MSAEIAALVCAALLQIGTLFVLAVFANMELGSRWTMSPRDLAPEHQLSRFTARLKRAYENHFEGLALFIAAVVAVEASGENSAVTALAAWAYVIARLAYVPAYVMGLAPWRSVLFGVGLMATLVMLFAALI